MILGRPKEELAAMAPMDRATSVLLTAIHGILDTGQQWPNHEQCRSALKVTLEALREPSEEMENAGAELCPDGRFDQGQGLACDVWQAMIDHLLSED